MKKRAYKNIMALGFFLVLATVSAQAQSAGETGTKVPYDFRIETQMPRVVEYRVHSISRDEDGTIGVLWNNATANQFQNDTENWDTNGFALGVRRSESLSDLIFTWKCRPPYHYDAFNVRVRISDGREGQVERQGGTRGFYRERNVEVGKTYIFMVQGCDKGTFSSNCTAWSELKIRHVRP